MRAQTVGDRTMRMCVAAAVDADESHAFKRSSVELSCVGDPGLHELAVLGTPEVADLRVMDQRAKLRDQKHEDRARGESAMKGPLAPQGHAPTLAQTRFDCTYCRLRPAAEPDARSVAGDRRLRRA